MKTGDGRKTYLSVLITGEEIDALGTAEEALNFQDSPQRPIDLQYGPTTSVSPDAEFFLHVVPGAKGNKPFIKMLKDLASDLGKRDGEPFKKLAAKIVKLDKGV